MRGKTVKNIDRLVKDFEVGLDSSQLEQLSDEEKLLFLSKKRKLKKRYWNKLSTDERSLRSQLVREEKL